VIEELEKKVDQLLRSKKKLVETEKRESNLNDECVRLSHSLKKGKDNFDN